jgi:hypothetical protein
MVTLRILLGAAMFASVFVFYLIVTMWRLQSRFNSISRPQRGAVGIDLVTLYHNMDSHYGFCCVFRPVSSSDAL